MYLQKKEINVADSCRCFDALIKTFPNMASYLSPEAKIIHTPNFTNAIIKI
jgi:hypothetical protein